MASVMIGCAGWSIPREAQAEFPLEGSHLERYARQLAAVEINSSFYRPHRRVTYEKWAAAVPADFRFAVKMPKAITHVAKLVDTGAGLDAFLAEVGGLGVKLGVLLVQLPPSLRFDAGVAGKFLEELRARHAGAVACEPRHPSWFGPQAEALFGAMRVARAAADPPPVPAAARPGGWGRFGYHRLHGSPKMYYSAYGEDSLERVAGELTRRRAAGEDAWCIFDNTAVGAATANALELQGKVGGTGSKTRGA